MKTLLIALYPYHARSLDAWHDHGAGMTFTHAKNADCDITFLDMKSLSNDAQLKEAMKGYDLITFGLKSSYYAMGMKIIKFAKELGSKVMIGGYHVTAAPNELLENPDIDYIFHGESEITFQDFLHYPSFYEREIWGERPQNLDDLAFFDRTIYTNHLEDCAGWWYGGKLTKMISVVSARGCPYKCGFCQPIEDNHFGKKLRRRSVDSLIEEMLWLKSTLNPECLMIHDDTFLIQPSWIEEFIEKYPKVGLPFWASGRADGICKHPDLVKRLVKVGWELVSVGFESGSQRILDKMNKGTTVEQNLQSAKIIHNAGAKIYGNYMIGLPWETPTDMQATARMVDEIKAEMPSWAFFTPYPGCQLGEECIEQGMSLLDRNHYDRCPYGQKVKGVDYTYVNAVLKGLRGEGNIKVNHECDIIIPTYENEDLTLACLESIKLCTQPGTYRVILVDNASKDTTKVEKALSTMNHLFIKMSKNEGFVLAVNRGLQEAKAPYVCLLNNDTVVSKNWLGKLTNALKNNPQLGIVGSLTMPDLRGGGHMDSHHSLSLHNTLIPDLTMSMEEINQYLETHYSGQTRPATFVAFLCAVIRKEVIDKVGPLDPNYELGMWDDNDYNIATRKLGFKCEFAIDTCIYHKGRSTFTLIEKNEGFNVNELLAKNKAYMDKKWSLGLTNYRPEIKGINTNQGPKLSWRDKIAQTKVRSKIEQSTGKR